MEELVILLLMLIPIVLIEAGVLVYLRERRPRVLYSSVIVNTLTNVPLNFFLMHTDDSMAAIATGEALVVLAEAMWYYAVTRNMTQTTVYSLLCNAVSFLTGLLVILLLYLTA